MPERLWPLVLFVVAAAWFLYRIGRPGVWTDEGVTLVVMHRTPAQLWRVWRGNDAPMMPYYLMMKTLRSASGMLHLPLSDVVLIRSVSALAMAGTAVALYLIVRRRSTTVLALATAVTFVAMPGVLRYAQEARPYALMMFASAITWLAWDVNRHRRDWRVRAVYVLAIVFGSLMHLVLLFQLAAQVSASLIDDWRGGARRPRAFRSVLSTLVPLVLGLVIVGLPLIYILRHGHGVPSGPITLIKAVTTMLQTVLNIHVWPVFGSFILISAVVGIVTLAVSNREALFVLLLWFAVPFVLQTLAGIVQSNTLRLRYWMALATPLAALVGAGVYGVAVFLAWTLNRAVRRHGAPATAGPLGAALVTLAVALTVLVLLPLDGYIRSNAGHGPVGATSGVMEVFQRTPNDPVLLVDSRFNGFAFAGYGLNFVLDNPYAAPNPSSRYVWGFERSPSEFRDALAGHGSVVFAHSPSGVTADTERAVADQITEAGFHRTETRRDGSWTIMVYERFTAANSSIEVAHGG